MITVNSRKNQGGVLNHEYYSFSAYQWKHGDECLVLKDGELSEARVWELNQNENIAVITFGSDLFDERHGNVGCRVSKGGI